MKLLIEWRKKSNQKKKAEEERFKKGILATNDGIPDDFKIIEGSGRSKYNNWMVDNVPSLSGKLRKVCLLCAFEKKIYFCYGVKENSQCQPHIKDFHPNVYSERPEEIKKAQKTINEVIEKKYYSNRGIKRERATDTSKRNIKFKEFWRDMTPLVYLEGLWCLMRNRPDLIVNDAEYRDLS